jgi:hypothetical protein
MRILNGGSRTLFVAAVVALGLVMSSALTAADETVYCQYYISSVPFKITTSGHYCFYRNLTSTLNAAPFAAILIDADFVWLDLNNFTLDGTRVGTATVTDGIVAIGTHKNITVRNGIVKGFFNGINLDGGGSNYTVENIWADTNYVNGIAARGTGGKHVVRNNVVTNTGGTTDPGENSGPNVTLGIEVSGPLSSAINNEITHTFNNSTNSVGAWAISLDNEGEGQVGVNNRVIGADVGIRCGFTPTTKVFLRDNIVLSAPVPYETTCNKIGTTNFP